MPDRELKKDKQRAVSYADECEGEFWSLGPHDKSRRRILLWKVPPGNPFYDPREQKLLKIPFLAFADESISDDDATLLPIIHGIMEDARRRYA